MKQIGGDGAPASTELQPKLAPQQKDALERAIGRKIASEDAGASLRRLLLDGGEAMQDGAFKLAVRKLRAARMLCRLSGLGQEEAAASIAPGSAATAAGTRAPRSPPFARARRSPSPRGTGCSDPTRRSARRASS